MNRQEDTIRRRFVSAPTKSLVAPIRSGSADYWLSPLSAAARRAQRDASVLVRISSCDSRIHARQKLAPVVNKILGIDCRESEPAVQS